MHILNLKYASTQYLEFDIRIKFKIYTHNFLFWIQPNHVRGHAIIPPSWVCCTPLEDYTRHTEPTEVPIRMCMLQLET